MKPRIIFIYNKKKNVWKTLKVSSFDGLKKYVNRLLENKEIEFEWRHLDTFSAKYGALNLVGFFDEEGIGNFFRIESNQDEELMKEIEGQWRKMKIEKMEKEMEKELKKDLPEVIEIFREITRLPKKEVKKEVEIFLNTKRVPKKILEHLTKISEMPRLSDNEVKELIKKIGKGDEEAKEKFIKDALKWVVRKVNRRYKFSLIFLLNLLKKSYIEFLKEIEKIDWKKETKAKYPIDPETIKAFVDNTIYESVLKEFHKIPGKIFYEAAEKFFDLRLLEK